MLIGKDFDKIEFDFFGLHLLEPNAFIGDVVILFVALYFAFQITKIKRVTPFLTNWKWFYFVFGIGFFLGGIGHTFYNYLGLSGKYPSWYSGILSTLFVEQAMFSLLKSKWKNIAIKLSYLKAVLAGIIATLVFATINLEDDVSKGLIVPTLNSVIGLGFSLGFLGYRFSKSIHPSFKWLWISALILIPSALIQAMKINIAPWFDRNDLSHILLIIGMFCYFITIKNYSNQLHAEKLT
jgi:hypothetical protein